MRQWLYFCTYQCLTYLLFDFSTALIEDTSSTQLIISSQGQSLASIIIVIDSSLPSWVRFLSLFLRENKTMSIQIYLPTLHYINILAFRGAYKSHGILINIRHFKGTHLVFDLFKAKIVCSSMDLCHYSHLLRNFLIHPQPIHLILLRG